jgi:xeroderma pigmentosum group C-complementing protein
MTIKFTFLSPWYGEFRPGLAGQLKCRKFGISHVRCFYIDRSLGWRARYVMVLEPLKRDLDVDHPLLAVNETKNVFMMAWKHIQADKQNGVHDVDDDDGGGKTSAKRQRLSKGKKRKRSTTPVQVPPPPISHGASRQRKLAWVEILCQTRLSGSKATKASKNCKVLSEAAPTNKMRWIHIDPVCELVNQPDSVEAMLFAEQEGLPPGKWSSSKRKVPIAYALAAEHVEVAHDDLRARLTDVTPRYASSWVETLKARGVLRGKQSRDREEERVDLWWAEALKCADPTPVPSRDKLNASTVAANISLSSTGKSIADAIVLDNGSDEEGSNKKLRAKVTTASTSSRAGPNPLLDIDNLESEEFSSSVRDEPIPTSKTAFASHPIYVLPSLMNTNEILLPDAHSRVCGFFKGERIYRRTDVRLLLPAKKWLYKGHKVKDEELDRPTKRIKARKKSLPQGFKALQSYGVGQANDGSEEHRANQLEMASQPLEDGMEDVYAPWQTIPWSPPPVGPDEAIPVNEFRNIELKLLNPGLVHVVEDRIAVVAKQLGMYVNTLGYYFVRTTCLEMFVPLVFDLLL